MPEQDTGTDEKPQNELETGNNRGTIFISNKWQRWQNLLRRQTNSVRTSCVSKYLNVCSWVYSRSFVDGPFTRIIESNNLSPKNSWKRKLLTKFTLFIFLSHVLKRFIQKTLFVRIFSRYFLNKFENNVYRQMSIILI